MPTELELLHRALHRVARDENGLQSRRHELVELRSLPVVQALMSDRGVGAPTAVTLTLDAGASALEAVESPSEGLMVGDVVAASLALGEWRDVIGLGHRLDGLGTQVERGSTTMRTRYREALLAVAEVLPGIALADIAPQSDEPKANTDSHAAELLQIRHVIRRRVPRVTIKEYTLRATGDEVSWHQAQGHYPNDPRDAAFSVRPISNCYLRDAKPAGTGSHRFNLRIPRTKPGQRVTFSYEYHVNSDVPDRPYLRHLAGQEIDRAIVQVQFENYDLPDKIWSFSNKDTFFEPLDSPPRSSLIKVNEVGFARVELDRQQKYEYFGLAWSWKLPDR